MKKNIKNTLKEFIEFKVKPFKHNFSIAKKRNIYLRFLKEHKEILLFFGGIDAVFIIFFAWQSYLIIVEEWNHPFISNEVLITVIFSIISILGVILALFESRRQTSKQINIQAKKRATLHLFKILIELSKDVDFTVQEYECVLYYFGLPNEFIILPECKDFLKNNPKLCNLLKEFVENFMYFDLDKEVKEYINTAHSDLMKFIDGKLPESWDQFTLVSQFQSYITEYFDKMIYDVNY